MDWLNFWKEKFWRINIKNNWDFDVLAKFIFKRKVRITHRFYIKVFLLVRNTHLTANVNLKKRFNSKNFLKNPKLDNHCILFYN
ncbi:hypothetical protein DQF64_06720 [Moraxella bovis]|nr:hypothetical protein DQF64_06720 [Moraxella bovis]